MLELFGRLTAPKLLLATVVSVLATLFTFGIAIIEEPPAFFAYIFGVTAGADWAFLFGLYLFYWEDNHEEEIPAPPAD